MPRFSKINIEISNICNLKCSFCPEVIRDAKLMDISDFKKIIAQVSDLTDQVCLHLMGDPLVHPKLSEFIKICEAHNTKIFLVTNGVLLREDRIQNLLNPAVRQVCFSLHSFKDNFPNQDPSSYLEKIFQFTEKANLERPDLYINYRLWNLQSVKNESHKNLEILERIETRFKTKVNLDFDVRRNKSIKLMGRLYLHFDTEFIWPSLDLPVLGEKGTCYGLESHFGVLVDGTVVPCCLDKEASIPLGNILETPVLDILNSKRAQNMLQGFKKHKLIEDLCQRCQYIERFK